jgi:prephenate dehydrogenase
VLQQLTIVAPGLLGGSIAQASRQRGLARRIVIWARRPETRLALKGEAWCDAAPESVEEAVLGADLVVLAAPVARIPALASQLGPSLRPGTIVTDVGSTKAVIARLCQAYMPEGVYFVPSHPMAGSEKTGWENSCADLFQGRVCFVTPTAATNASAAARVKQFWEDVGMTVAAVNPDAHDEIVAHVSHLPQVLSSTLSCFLSRMNPGWRGFAGNGLKDTLRIAGSDTGMWLDILDHNREEILRALKAFEGEIHQFTSALENKDTPALKAVLERGREYRRGM